MNQNRKRSLPLSSADANANAAPLFAGYISGSLSLIAGYPLDSLRVWSQSGRLLNQQQARMASTSTSLNIQCATARQGISCPLNRAHLVRPDMAQSAARRIALRAASSSTSCAIPSRTLATRPIFVSSFPSVKSLYRGIAGPLVSVGCVQAIGFATYDQTRRQIRTAASGHSSADDLHEDSLHDVAIAAFASGSVVSVITAPLIAIKIRQQLSGGGFWHIVRDSYRQRRSGGGIRSFYTGFSAHFALESLGRAVFFACYEGIKREMQYFDADGVGDSTCCSRSACTNANLSLGQRMAAAGASGIISTSLLLPLDAIRTRVNSSQVSPLGTSGISVSRAASDLWQMGGARAFFRGLWASLFRAGPVSALSLPAYDLALEWLDPN